MIGQISKIPIAVISDGKPGHENQSLGIAEHIPNSDILLLRLNLRESLPEAWLRMQIRFFPGPKINPRRFLDSIFSENEIESLVDHKPVAIIAAGTLSAGPCILAGRLTGAKTCICMKPSMLPLSMFDLAVVPAHDNPPDKPNILKTLAAPNRVSPHLLKEEYEKWSGEFPDDENVISWIIGGPSTSANFDEKHVMDGLVSTLDWAESNGWRVWLSTARRTPESLEKAISELSQKYHALSWMLLWHLDQRNPLYAMFHRSRLAIVTSDSVSMIAEAASAGKGPLIYRSSMDEKRKRTKQDFMIDGLINADYGILAMTDDILVKEIRSMLESGKEFPLLQETKFAAGEILALVSGD